MPTRRNSPDNRLRPLFPISIRFEDGSTETFNNIDSLETDLEPFDSNSAPACEVRDALGRGVRLKVNDRLVLEELALIDDS